MIMEGYVFIRGVDGFGADVAPAYEYGCYLDYDKAFRKLCELNARALEDSGRVFYEQGYGVDYYPDDNIILREAEENEDEAAYEAEMKKHELTDIVAICNRIMEYDEPPIGTFSMVEIQVKK